ncbi:ankyrin repeat, SAM and basic leucine zipper domain-containing protein 1 [Spodoptera frugiperda]|uniref:Ankyrin repeat, SAM and basic leucine zipper domain-containing protein 1 n=1 Tax=Spodoptera frugiperda TaxID=7108 RepID=A0A9R0E8K4_SPOFR|nr:ankyrin repeat, SAM and basic leucine zipper domain-containing protein 1 [Spodoptera frugiperda]
MTHTAGRPGGESDSDPDDYYGYFDEPPRNHFQYQQHNDKKKLEMDLQDAIINGSLAEVEEIVATRLNNNVNTRLDSGWTALMHACFHAQDAIVKYLLEEGADPNFRSDSMTPIMTVCSNSNANNKVVYNIVTNLLEKNCKLNCMDNYGQTPLMKAVGCGRVDIVQKFLDLGVNIEVRDLQGWTALFWAAHHNQPQILEILIAHGARMSEVDKYNRTALDLAELHEYNEVAEILKKHLQIPEDHEESFDMEMTTWHDFYPGIKKGKSPDYKSEIPHLLYGMHLENFTKTIMKSGMDLRTFLLLEESDMVKLGMDLPYERQRLKNGLRHFHKRNWKLKAVSGLALQTTDNFSMLNYLTSLGSHLHQIYVLETTLQYTLREYNKIQDQIKFEPPESPIREKMVNAAKKMLSNIDCIKRASARVRIVLEKIAEENPEPADLIREKTMRDVVLGYFTEAVVVACIGIMVYQARNFFSQFLRK